MQSLALAFVAIDGGRRRNRRGDGELAFIGIGHRTGRVSGGHRNLLGAQQHFGAHVLDRLEAADRLAELLAHLRVLGGGVQCPADQPRGLGGEHGRGDVLDPLGRNLQHLRPCGVDQNPRQRTGEVRCLQRFDRHAVGRRVHEQPLVAGWQQQHPVRIGAEHVRGGARHLPAVKEHVGRQCDTGGALARRQRLEQVGV